MNALVIFDDERWLRIVDNALVARGETLDQAMPLDPDEVVVGIVPAREVAIRTVLLPGLAEAQARTAARLAAEAASISPGVAMHVVAGPADADGARAVVSVEARLITERLLMLAAHGLDPDHLIAAPLLLPIPVSGFVRGDFGNEVVVRGTDVAFPDDAALTPLLTAGAEIATLGRDELEASLIDAVVTRPADLRSGPFVKRRGWRIDDGRLRRMAVLLLIAGVLVLSMRIVDVIRTNAAAATLEAEAVTRAASLLPPGTVVTDPAMQVEAQLAAVGGAGGGFYPYASVLAAAVDSVAGAELGALVFDGSGGLRATVRGKTAADLTAVEARLLASGLAVVPGPVVAGPAGAYRDLTVQAR